MSESPLNRRRHGVDLHIRDKDLLTGRDCRRLIAEAIEEFSAAEEHRRAVRAALVALHDKLPWWKRAARSLSFRAEPFMSVRFAERSEAP